MTSLNLVKLFIRVVFFFTLQQEGCCTSSDHILCEHSSLEIECPNQSVITSIKVTLPNSTSNENVCTTPVSSKEGVVYNETIIELCIGNPLCRILSTDIDFTLIPDQTRRLDVNYTCQDFNTRKSLCPEDLGSVECFITNKHENVEITSVHLKKWNSICMRKDKNWCAGIIENRTKEVCNGRPTCYHFENVHKFIREQLHVQQVAESDWNTCIRIPKYFNVSFSCTDAIKGTLSEKEKSPLSRITDILGISVGVSAGIIIIVLASLVLIRRLSSKRNSQSVIYENTTGLGQTNKTATNDAQGNYVPLQQSRDVSNYTELNTLKQGLSLINDAQGNYTALQSTRDVPNYTELNNVRPGLNMTNGAQENYTLLQQTKDVPQYAELTNVTPALNLTNDHNYMEVI